MSDEYLQLNKPEPDPPTPEELFTLQRENWFDAPFDYKRAPHEIIDMLDALRDMIESDRAEIGLLTDTVNRQDRLITEFVTTTAGDFREVAQRLFSLENPISLASPDPETVAVPRSLVDALAVCRPHIGTAARSVWSDLADEYDAWKAGQR